MRCLFLLLLFAVPLQAAVVETHRFDSADQEAQYRTLIDELRCLVCQNQNLADSNAELAKDLRAKVYRMVREGKSSEEVVDYMVERYGDFVLYRPPLKPVTVLLWLGPFLLLLVGVVVLIRVLRRQNRAGELPVDDEALAQARTLLQREERP